MTAHYFKDRNGAYLIIARGPSPVLANRIAEIKVSGKVEARKIAAAHNAKCWNF